MKKRVYEIGFVKKGTVVDISQAPAIKKLKELYKDMSLEEKDRTGDYLRQKQKKEKEVSRMGIKLIISKRGPKSKGNEESLEGTTLPEYLDSFIADKMGNRVAAAVEDMVRAIEVMKLAKPLAVEDRCMKEFLRTIHGYIAGAAAFLTVWDSKVVTRICNDIDSGTAFKHFMRDKTIKHKQV